MVRVLLFLLVVIFSFSADTIAQEAEMSTELLVRYQETLPLYQELVSGGQYSDAPASYLGSPFYDSPKFDLAQIWVNGLPYSQVQLIYDVWQDQVLVVHPVFAQKVLIKSDKIDQFIFSDGTRFLRFESNPGYGKHKHGFYQLVVDGEPSLLKKHWRTLESVKETGLITKEFRVGADYFFLHEGNFWRASSKNEAMSALGLSKKEVSDHFKGKRLEFKKDPEAYLLELLRLRRGVKGDFKGNHPR